MAPCHSLQCCKNKLLKPFYFTSCDSICTPPFEKHNENWIGIKKINATMCSQYSTVIMKKGLVQTLINKKQSNSNECFAFTGLAFIKNYDVFWEGIENAKYDSKTKEREVLDGFQNLADKSSLAAYHVDWLDAGDPHIYREATQNQKEYDFSKENEVIYIHSNKIIKWFKHKDKIMCLKKRADLKPRFFPKNIRMGEEFISYKKACGDVFYQNYSSSRFIDILNELKKYFWTHGDTSQKQKDQFLEEFYYIKTIKRFYLLKKKVRESNQILPDIKFLDANLKTLPWEELKLEETHFIHGDLQFDNIIFDPQSNLFTLIDWRDQFSGLLDIGDIYYDLAKMKGGIILNYYLIKKGCFQFYQNDSNIWYHLPKYRFKEDALSIFNQFIDKYRFNHRKINLLVGIIYLNMAPLHHPPFDLILIKEAAHLLRKLIHGK